MEIEIIEDNLDIEKLSHISPNIGARAVFFVNDKLCLVHYKKADRYTLPGGGVNEGESLEAALKREVLEETGYHVISNKKTLTIKEYFTDSVWHHHYFFVEVDTTKHSQSLTEEEQFEGLIPVFKPLNEVLELFAFQDSNDPYHTNINKRELLGLMHSLE